MPKIITQEEFIKRCIDTHGVVYDYSCSVYENLEKKVKIKCKNHGIFLQTPNNHIKGRGCPKCSHEKFLKRVKSDAINVRDKAIFNYIERTVIIPLSKSCHSIIDLEDYHKISKYFWRKSKDGYAVRSTKKGTVRLHKQIIRCPDGFVIDHIDGDRLNNRKSNLRIVTYSQNLFNQKPIRKGTSKYKGVFWNKYKGRWTARISFNKKQIFIGHFNSETEAAKAYDEAAKKYHKQFSLTNSKFYGQI